MNNSSRGCVIKRLSWKAGHAWRYNWLITSGKSSLRLLIFAIRSLASVQLAGVMHEMFLLSRMIIKSANWFRSPIKEGTYSPPEKLIHMYADGCSNPFFDERQRICIYIHFRWKLSFTAIHIAFTVLRTWLRDVSSCKDHLSAIKSKLRFRYLWHHDLMVYSMVAFYYRLLN